MRLALLSATVATAAIAVACFAQATPPTPGAAAGHRGMKMMRADTDGDRAITKTDMVALAEARFAKLDSNRDGKVTEAETRAARATMRERIMARRAAAGRGGAARLDPDGDKLIAKADWQARSAERFDRIDTNRDGSLDQAERAQMAQRRHHRRGMRGTATPPPSAGS